MTAEGSGTSRPELGHLLDDATGTATRATLASIVDRSRRRRERRLKLITGVSIAVALAGLGVAGITSATKSGPPSASKNDLVQSEHNAAIAVNPAWTRQHRT